MLFTQEGASEGHRVMETALQIGLCEQPSIFVNIPFIRAGGVDYQVLKGLQLGTSIFLNGQKKLEAMQTVA